MLTVPQADIISLLNSFKCLRYSHIRKYAAAKYHSSDEHVTKMINQLRFMGKLQVNDGYVMLPGRKTDGGVIKAIDVMMDLTDGHTEMFYPGTSPFTLMFSIRSGTGDAVCACFGVAVAERYCEGRICGQLRMIDRNLTVIFVLSDPEQQKLLKTGNKHYFAVQNEQGKYKFYKAADQAAN